MFPEVTSQIEGDGEAITPETFRKLLSEIKEKEMAGALQVMTYYQYYQYRVQCQAEAEALKLEYEIFANRKMQESKNWMRKSETYWKNIDKMRNPVGKRFHF